jgi:23S rRNA pseudouridine1911/1915/1917 synthase
MEISKVYEDDSILIINKPYGLITHPKNATDTQPGLTDWVASNYPELKDVGEPFSASGSPYPRHGIVHRLDKKTSGLIVIAKSQEVFYYLKNLFQTHTIHKHYYALVHGKPKESSGIINAPLGRIGMKRTTQMEGKKMIDGKDSVTEYKTVKNFDKYTLLEVSPKTGRTHQIRVHLKSIGCPVAGDSIYAPKGWHGPEGLKRLFLHAYKLEFPAPDGKRLVIEADLPEDLQNVLNELK